jgi:hypothetical protein
MCNKKESGIKRSWQEGSQPLQELSWFCSSVVGVAPGQFSCLNFWLTPCSVLHSSQSALRRLIRELVIRIRPLGPCQLLPPRAGLQVVTVHAPATSPVIAVDEEPEDDDTVAGGIPHTSERRLRPRCCDARAEGQKQAAQPAHDRPRMGEVGIPAMRGPEPEVSPSRPLLCNDHVRKKGTRTWSSNWTAPGGWRRRRAWRCRRIETSLH